MRGMTKILGSTAGAAWCAAALLAGCAKAPAPPPPAAAPVAEARCDRQCLESLVDQFLDAVIAHDPRRLPVAPDFRYTENGQKLDTGDGIWRTLNGKGRFRMFVTDVEAGHVAFLGTVREDDIPAVIAVHLAVRNRRIASAEIFVQRNDKSADGFDRIGYAWTDGVPAAQRMPRAVLMSVANQYFAGLQRNDGKGDYPFTDDCNRVENGMFTTNVPTPRGEARPDPKSAERYSLQWGCREQFQSGLLHFVNRIRDRRFVAVDQERGIVFAFGFFDHSGGATRTFKTPDGRTVTSGPVQPWTWQIAELFKVEKGQIRKIEAFLQRSPYGMNSGWSTWSQGMSDAARDVTGE